MYLGWKIRLNILKKLFLNLVIMLFLILKIIFCKFLLIFGNKEKFEWRRKNKLKMCLRIFRKVLEMEFGWCVNVIVSDREFLGFFVEFNFI